MDLRRMHDTLTSLAVSAMLTSALLSTAPGTFVAAASGPQPQILIDALTAARAAAWNGGSNIALPEPVAAPQAAAKAAPAPSSRILSEAQLNKMLQFVARIGVDAKMAIDVTRALGLTTDDQVLTVRQIRYTDDNNPSAPPHFFGPLPNGEFLFIREVAPNAYSIRADKNLNLITAVFRPRNQTATTMPVAQAQQMLREELKTWADAVGPVTVVADK